MNRRERRAARRQQDVDVLVAVHEAGHVVGRVLKSAVLGWSPEEAVSHVDVGLEVAPAAVSLDRSRLMTTQATTYGMMFSRPMHDFLSARGQLEHFASADVAQARRICDEMRPVGIDVDAWCLAKCFECVLGPAAEANFCGRSVDDVLYGYNSEADLSDAIRYCLMAGKTVEEAQAVINEAKGHAEEKIARPEVWTAVLALSEELRTGRTPGRRAVRVVMRAMERGRNPGNA